MWDDGPPVRNRVDQPVGEQDVRRFNDWSDIEGPPTLRVLPGNATGSPTGVRKAPEAVPEAPALVLHHGPSPAPVERDRIPPLEAARNYLRALRESMRELVNEQDERESLPPWEK